MKSFYLAVYFTLIVAVSAQPGYKYQQPPQAPLPGPIAPPVQNIHHSVRTQTQAGNGVFSAVQSQPLPQYIPPSAPSAPQQSYVAPQQLPPPPPPAPAPIQLPQQSYLPPTQAVPSISQGHQQQIVQQQLSLPIQPQPQYGAAQLSLPIGAPQQNSFQQSAFQSFQRPQTAIITKDIYIHSAPEDQEENALGQQLENAPIRKNYRIVFIKAPSQNLKLAAAALKHAQSANEEKTVIYVLSKKPDLTEVQQQLQQAQGQQKTHKPEVYFIKYKTQEEAQRAQQEIQAQYDALGGSTHISDEGVAPVRSVIGSSDGGLNLGGSIGQQSFSQQQNYQSQSSVSFNETPSPQYLPVKKK